MSQHLATLKICTNFTHPTSLCNLLVFEKIYSWLFIPNCTRNHVITFNNCTGKFVWLRINNIREKIRDSTSEAKRASNAKIIYSNRAFGQNNCEQLKQENTMIFPTAQKSSKSDYTVQGIVQSASKSLSMKWNRRLSDLTLFVFNFGVE